MARSDAEGEVEASAAVARWRRAMGRRAAEADTEIGYRKVKVSLELYHTFSVSAITLTADNLLTRNACPPILLYGLAIVQ